MQQIKTQQFKCSKDKIDQRKNLRYNVKCGKQTSQVEGVVL